MLSDEDRSFIEDCRKLANWSVPPGFVFHQDARGLLAIIDRLTRPETVLAEAERLLRTPADHRIARIVFSRNHVTLTDCDLAETEGLSLVDAYEERMQKLAEEARKGLAAAREALAGKGGEGET